MATQTILVTGTGTAGHDGFYIVNSGTDLQNGTGSAEDLLDHHCNIARAN
jgi:CDP-diacylglycerol pyrophosphatase